MQAHSVVRGRVLSSLLESTRSADVGIELGRWSYLEEMQMPKIDRQNIGSGDDQYRTEAQMRGV